ncbi:MAG TPA: ABC transporter permease [Acidimicrobiia bacterium]|nr:ABC transporter permease [Acidimicrobiia bacterium]
MSDFLPFVVAGLATGSLYGLAGLGLVLTYKTSGVFNFGHGGLAALSAFAFYSLRQEAGLPWPLAAAICLVVIAPLAGLLLEALARSLATAGPEYRIVATVGLLIAVSGLATAIYGPAARSFDSILPTSAVELAGVRVGVDQMLVMALAALAAGGLVAFFRFSQLGLAMRGLVDGADLLALTGARAGRVRRLAWIIGTVFAAGSGILLAPTIGLDAVLLSFLVIQAFGAAAIGRFSSLPLTYLGGLAVGVVAALSTKYVADLPALAGFPPSVPFVVLFAVLLLAHRSLPAESERRHRAGRLGGRAARAAPKARITVGGATAAALLGIPEVVGTRLPLYTSGLIFVIVFVSLGLLVRTSGQTSLCHAAFAAVGASTFSHLVAGAGLPWAVGLLGAAAVTGVVGAVMALPAIRLSGLYLALATFGFGVLLERMVFTTAMMFGARGARLAPRPDFAVSDRGFYYVVLAVVALAVAISHAVRRTRLGRLLSGLADSPRALASLGVNTWLLRLLVFALSAALAGVAGALFGTLAGSVNGVGFNAVQSLLWLSVLAIAGPWPVASAFVAAALVAVLPGYLGRDVAEWQPVAFGVAAMAAGALSGRAQAVRGWIRRQAEISRGRAGRGPVQARHARAGRISEALVAGAVTEGR